MGAMLELLAAFKLLATLEEAGVIELATDDTLIDELLTATLELCDITVSDDSATTLAEDICGPPLQAANALATAKESIKRDAFFSDDFSQLRLKLFTEFSLYIFLFFCKLVLRRIPKTPAISRI